MIWLQLTPCISILGAVQFASQRESKSCYPHYHSENIWNKNKKERKFETINAFNHIRNFLAKKSEKNLQLVFVSQYLMLRLVFEC